MQHNTNHVHLSEHKLLHPLRNTYVVVNAFGLVTAPTKDAQITKSLQGSRHFGQLIASDIQFTDVADMEDFLWKSSFMKHL
jgi:hypothetical protein